MARQWRDKRIKRVQLPTSKYCLAMASYLFRPGKISISLPWDSAFCKLLPVCNWPHGSGNRGPPACPLLANGCKFYYWIINFIIIINDISVIVVDKQCHPLALSVIPCSVSFFLLFLATWHMYLFDIYTRVTQLCHIVMILR